MTKDEAIAAIIDSRNRMKTWATYVSEVREIIDQIDQPGEFSVRELVEFMQAHGPYTRLEINAHQDWLLIGRKNYAGQGVDALRAKLLELAKPPEPKTVMVELPTKAVREYANLSANIGSTGEILKASCKAALEKAGVKL